MKKIIVVLIFLFGITLNLSAEEKKCKWKLGDPILSNQPIDDGNCPKSEKKSGVLSKVLSNSIGENIDGLGKKAKSTGKNILGKLKTESKLTDWIKNRKK